MPALENIRELVERFEYNRGLYHVGKYKSTNRAIDRLVYDLYGLTEDEIKIVEGR